METGTHEQRHPNVFVFPAMLCDMSLELWDANVKFPPAVRVSCVLPAATQPDTLKPSPGVASR